MSGAVRQTDHSISGCIVARQQSSSPSHTSLESYYSSKTFTQNNGLIVLSSLDTDYVQVNSDVSEVISSSISFSDSVRLDPGLTLYLQYTQP